MASQEELKAIKELTQSIGKEMDSLSEKSDKRNKKLLAEADAVKSIASELSSQKEAQNAIIDLQQRINNLSGKNLGVNEGMKDSLQDQMEAAKSAFNIRKNEFKVTEKVASAVDSRIILDTGGAEKISDIGTGLYLDGTLSEPKLFRAPNIIDIDTELDNLGVKRKIRPLWERILF